MGVNVLSLFDGMSCGQQALERAGIEVDNYFASEIDKYAIQVTMANYPNTKQLGSVVNVNGFDLPKIDILIGGSPCQSFSFAGKRKGMATKCETEILTLNHYLELKADGYEFEGQSYLFWEFMRLLNECKPKYFLLENVEMGEKWEKVLSKAIGVNGIHINSALVSAQNRKRIYWTNIGMQPGGLFGDLVSMIKQPKDKGILLKNVLESEVNEKYFLSEKAVDGIIQHKSEQKEKGHGFGAVIKNDNEKMNSLTVGGKGINDLIVHNTMPRSSTTGKGCTGHLSRTDGKTYCLDTGNTNAVEIKLTSKDKRLQKIVDNNVFINGEVAHLDTYNQTIDKDKSPALKLPHNDRFIIAPTKRKNLVEIVAMRGRGEKGNIVQQFETNGTNKSNSLTTVQKDNLIRQLNPSKESGGTQPYQQNRIYDVVANGAKEQVVGRKAQEDGTYKREYEVSNDEKAKTLETNKAKNNVEIREVKQISTNNKSNGATQPYQQNRIYDPNGISPALCAYKADLLILGCDYRKDEGFRFRDNGKSGTLAARARNDESCGQLASINTSIRRLTPVECERLQTVKDNYTNHVSDSQRYKMLGNGWTIDVIAHIFKYL